MNQMIELYDPVADLQRYVDGNYVREAKIKGFRNKYKNIILDTMKKGSGETIHLINQNQIKRMAGTC